MPERKLRNDRHGAEGLREETLKGKTKHRCRITEPFYSAYAQIRVDNFEQVRHATVKASSRRCPRNILVSLKK